MKPGPRRYGLTVHGKNHTWLIDVEARPEHVEDWRNDGLLIDELVNSIPEWAVALGLTKPWCCVQDALNWRPRKRR